MLALDSPRWAELRTAYGDTVDVPAMLRDLESVPNSRDFRDEPWFSMWSALAHQGNVYAASFAAGAHVVRVHASAPEGAGSDYFDFPTWVEICRRRTGTEVPEDLRDAYASALEQLPALAAAAASRPWDEGMLRSVLAAVAVAKGSADIAEVVLELDPETARGFLGSLSQP